MSDRFYDTPAWQQLRALVLDRDGRRCTVGRLLGGSCHSRLDAHHLTPIVDGGAPLDPDNVITVCASHHPRLEALRRAIVEQRARRIPPCRHRHRYDHARRECRARRERAAA